MNVVTNNLVALLSDGAFNTESIVAPMSSFKWQSLLKIAEIEDVVPYIYKGLLRHNNDISCNIPNEILSDFANKKFTNEDSLKIELNLKHIDSLNLSSIVKRYILKEIIYKECHAIDTSTTSLNLLGLIIQNSHIILKSGIRLRGIVELGIFLRTQGQNVDYIKLSGWIQKIKLSRMSCLQASVLYSLFGFEENEFPFIKKIDNSSYKLSCKSLDDIFRLNKCDRKLSKYNIKNCFRFYKYTPTEATSKAFGTLIKSLSEIEE